MTDYRPGDEVLAPWLEDGFLYPGVVVRLDGAAAHIAYLDGDTADLPLDRLRHGAFGPGLSVSVNWKGRGGYYPGTILGRIGQAVDVAFADGTREWTVVAKCRLAQAVAGTLSLVHVVCSYCGNKMAGSAVKCDGCGAGRPGRE